MPRRALLPLAVLTAVVAAAPVHASWVAPVGLAGGPAAEVSVHPWSGGDALVVWRAGRTVQARVVHRDRTLPDASWTVASDAQVAGVAVAGGGAWVAFNRGVGPGARAFLAVPHEGGSREEPLPGVTGPALAQRIAGTPRGDLAVLAVTVDPAGPGRVLLVRRRPDGTWLAPVDLGASNEVQAPRLALGPGGALVLASWEDGPLGPGNRPGRGRILVRTAAPDGPLGPAVALGAGDGRSEPRVVADDAGGALVAWEEYRSLPERATGPPGTLRIRTAYRPAGASGFEPTRTVSRGDSNVGLDLAVAGTRAALVWSAGPGSGDDLRAVVGAAGRWGAPQRASAPLTGRSLAGAGPGYGRIALSPDGDAIVVSPYGPSAAVHVSARSRGAGRFGPVAPISPLGRGGAPAVAMVDGDAPSFAVAYAGPAGVQLRFGDATRARPWRDRQAPRVRMTPLRRSGRLLRATVRCDEACVVLPSARITATGPPRQRIRRHALPRVVLLAGRRTALTWELTAAQDEVLGNGGRLQVRARAMAADRFGRVGIARAEIG